MVVVEESKVKNPIERKTKKVKQTVDNLFFDKERQTFFKRLRIV
ncbi:hypothetical protein FACS189459_7300 [Bacilli bacterium]|nr:hypothetical protein FACS189459_7300 [Bacilli bacterium]